MPSNMAGGPRGPPRDDDEHVGVWEENYYLMIEKKENGDIRVNYYKWTGDQWTWAQEGSYESSPETFVDLVSEAASAGLFDD